MDPSTSPPNSPPSLSNSPTDHRRHVTLQPHPRPSSESVRTSSSLPNARIRRSEDIRAEEEGENEQSPLLPTRTSDDMGKVPNLPGVLSPENNGSEETWNENGMEHTLVQSRSWWFLLKLTTCFFGLQFAWAVEQSEITPFILDLGISKGVMAIIWIAGPLSGVVVQPYVGMMSDRCTSRFGKRRPFMVGGAIAMIVSLMLLAWSFEVTSEFLSVFGIKKDSEGTRITATVAAVLMLYVLDFSINVLQASARAFVVDSAPMHQQDFANAWASRVSGIGDILGFTFGYLKLGRYLHALGGTQFQDLSFLTGVALAVSVTVTVLTIPERDGRLAERSDKQQHGLTGFFRELWSCLRGLSRQIKTVCLVQLAAWIGWFPVLFYTSTWIRDLYMSSQIAANPSLSFDDPNLSEDGTRLGSLGLLIKAGVAITGSIVFPWIVKESPYLTLKRSWFISHVIFAVLMGFTFMVDSVTSAIVITACLGVPWAIMLWVPFALIAAEMKKDEEKQEAGAILGIHNMAIALPQVLAILASSAIFEALQEKSGQVSPESTAWVLRFGGVLALVAAGLTLRLDKERIEE